MNQVIGLKWLMSFTKMTHRLRELEFDSLFQFLVRIHLPPSRTPNY